MSAVLVGLAIVVGVFGVALASQATAGVAITSWACLLAIFARITQAERQHKEKMEAHDALRRRLSAEPQIGLGHVKDVR